MAENENKPRWKYRRMGFGPLWLEVAELTFLGIVVGLLIVGVVWLARWALG